LEFHSSFKGGVEHNGLWFLACLFVKGSKWLRSPSNEALLCVVNKLYAELAISCGIETNY
jgi:hypothetical protein